MVHQHRGGQHPLHLQSLRQMQAPEVLRTSPLLPPLSMHAADVEASEAPGVQNPVGRSSSSASPDPVRGAMESAVAIVAVPHPARART